MTGPSRTILAFDRFQQRHAWAGFLFAVAKKYGDDEAGSLAALIAYYGFFSVFPLMLVFVSVLGIVLADNAELQQRIIDSALAQFPIVGPTIVNEVTAITGNVVALAVGLASALWAGLGVVQAGQRAMNRVWNVPKKDWPTFVASRLRSLVMLGVLGAVTLASTLLSGLATTLERGGSLDRIGQLALSFLLNIALFLLVFRVLTRLDLRWRDVLPGGIVAAVLWTVLQGLGGLYVSHTIAGASNVYGTFALVIGLLVWIALGAQLTLYCAEINVVRARRLWPRSLTPLLTEADRRVLRAGALVERRRPEQHIEVTFDSPDRSTEAEAPTSEHDGN